MQYHIFVNKEFKDRIDPATIEAIEASFGATLDNVSAVYDGALYQCRNIYLTTK